jgi:hypothetical protein
MPVNPRDESASQPRRGAGLTQDPVPFTAAAPPLIVNESSFRRESALERMSRELAQAIEVHGIAKSMASSLMNHADHIVSAWHATGAMSPQAREVLRHRAIIVAACRACRVPLDQLYMPINDPRLVRARDEWAHCLLASRDRLAAPQYIALLFDAGRWDLSFLKCPERTEFLVRVTALCNFVEDGNKAAREAFSLQQQAEAVARVQPDGFQHRN